MVFQCVLNRREADDVTQVLKEFGMTHAPVCAGRFSRHVHLLLAQSLKLSLLLLVDRGQKSFGCFLRKNKVKVVLEAGDVSSCLVTCLLNSTDSVSWGHPQLRVTLGSHRTSPAAVSPDH